MKSPFLIAGSLAVGATVIAVAVLSSHYGAPSKAQQPADELPQPARHIATAKMTPVPKDFEVSATFSKKDYLLGENVPLTYRVKNTGKESFHVDSGGDYRGAPRATRFVVNASGPDGKQCLDPFLNSFNCSGGLGGPSTIKPGTSFGDTVQLQRYCFIPAPGKYEVTIGHDLGWGVDSNHLITATANASFRQPTAEQAKAVFDKLTKPYATAISADNVSSDLSSMCYPMYLPMLKSFINHQLARGLTADSSPSAALAALTAVELMGGPESTSYLIDLAGNSNKELAETAAYNLKTRLPGTTKTKPSPQAEARMKDAWRPEFAGRVRALANKYLARSAAENTSSHLGAAMIQSIGSAKDTQTVINSLERALNSLAATDSQHPNYSAVSDSINWLQMAASSLAKRGVVKPFIPKTNGEKAFFIAALKASPEFRPQGWQAICNELRSDKLALIREQATSLPSDQQTLISSAELLKLLKDPNPEVAIAACTKVRQGTDKDLSDAILEILRSSQNGRMLDGATLAATNLGILPTALNILATRLDESDSKLSKIDASSLKYEMFTILLESCVDLSNTNGYGAQLGNNPDFGLLKPAWVALLNEAASTFKASKKLKLTDALITPKLFPNDFHLELKSGESWPKANESPEMLFSTASSAVHNAELELNGENYRECQKSIFSALDILRTFSQRGKPSAAREYSSFPSELSGVDAQVWVFQRAITLLADSYMATDEFDKAIPLYGQALSLISGVTTFDGKFVLSAKPLSPGEIDAALKNLQLAESVKSHDDAENFKRSEAVEDARCLAVALDMQKHFDAAEGSYQFVVPKFSLFPRHVSSDHSSIPKVEASYKKLVANAENALGATNPLTATRYEIIARFYEMARKEKDAAAYYEKAVAIRKAHPSTATPMQAYDEKHLATINELLKEDRH